MTEKPSPNIDSKPKSKGKQQAKRIRKMTEKPSQKKVVRRIRKMGEEAGRKKVVDRRLALALGTTCIVLLAGLVGAIVVYTPTINNLESQVAEKNNMISSLNSTVLSLQNSLNQSNSNMSSMNSQIAALNYQISNLFNYLYLNVSGALVYNQTVYQDTGANTTVWNDTLNFAGYITVDVQSSTNTTYVELAYVTRYGVNYDNIVNVGTGGTEAFPVLPGFVSIIVGNKDTGNNTVATLVNAVYYY